MNAPDLVTICKCDRFIRFKIDGSTIRTHLMFAIKYSSLNPEPRKMRSNVNITITKLPESGDLCGNITGFGVAEGSSGAKLADKLDKQNINNNTNSFRKYLKNENSNTFFLFETNMHNSKQN